MLLVQYFFFNLCVGTEMLRSSLQLSMEFVQVRHGLYIFLFDTSSDEYVSDQYDEKNWRPLRWNHSAVQKCDSC